MWPVAVVRLVLCSVGAPGRGLSIRRGVGVASGRRCESDTQRARGVGDVLLGLLLEEHAARPELGGLGARARPASTSLPPLAAARV